MIFSGQRKSSQRVRSNMWMIHHRLSACCLYVPCVVNLWGTPQSRREKEAPTVDYDTLSALRGRRIGLHSICCYGRFRKWWNVIIKATSSRLIMTRNQYGWLIFTIAESERLSSPPPPCLLAHNIIHPSQSAPVFTTTAKSSARAVYIFTVWSLPVHLRMDLLTSFSLLDASQKWLLSYSSSSGDRDNHMSLFYSFSFS